MVDIPNQRPPPPSNFEEDEFETVSHFRSFASLDDPPVSPPAPSRKRTYCDGISDPSWDLEPSSDSANPGQRPSKKKKKAKHEELTLATKLAIFPPDKNSVCVLNEVGLNTTYELVSAEGPAHIPSFCMKVTIDGIAYEGHGASKKSAKEAAARAAVTALSGSGLEKVGTPEEVEKKVDEELVEEPSPELPRVEQLLATFKDQEFQCVAVKETSVQPEMTCHSSNSFISSSFRCPSVATNGSSMQELRRTFDTLSKEKLGTLRAFLQETVTLDEKDNLVGQALTILAFLKLTYDMQECAITTMQVQPEKTTQQYSFRIIFLEERFEGLGFSKKSAKNNVAAQFLNWFLDISPVIWRFSELSSALELSASGDICTEHGSADQFTAISRRFASDICFASYEIADSIASKLAGSKLIGYLDLAHMAVVCISRPGQLLTPIALASGCSVIYRKNLTNRGRHLKDSQSEVLALRATKYYLLTQVAAFFRGEDSIFQCLSNESLLELKPDIAFHLFITSSPSGVAAQEPTSKMHFIDGEVVPRICPAASSVVANSFWDITAGHGKLKIMSSGDKLLKKSVMGIQGSLCSLFVQPIFLQTVCVKGGVVDLPQMTKTLYQRLLSAMPKDSVEIPLRCPEVMETPLLSRMGMFSVKEPVSLKALVWFGKPGNPEGVEEFVETSAGVLKYTEHGSALSKYQMGALFRMIVAENAEKLLTKRIPVEELLKDTATYGEVKQMTGVYAKKLVFFQEAVERASLGSWIGKCPEEEAFVLPSSRLSPGGGADL